MPCINLDLKYFSDIKTRRLRGKLGQWAEALPIKLWIFAGEFHPETGELIGYKNDELISMIDANIETTHDATSILQGLQDCGFISKVKGGYKICNWHEDQGHIAAYAIRGKKAAKARWAKINEFSQKSASSMPQALQTEKPSNAPTNLTDLTKLKEEEEGDPNFLESENNSKENPTDNPEITQAFHEKEKKKKSKSNLPPEPFVMPSALAQNEKFMEAWCDYLDMRNKKKKPATEKAKDLVIKSLREFSGGNPAIAIEILNRSTKSSWTDVYPIKQEFQKKQVRDTPEDIEFILTGPAT